MSHTQAEHRFAGLHQTGANDVLQSFFRARGHHLLYGTFPYLWPPINTSSQTALPVITIVIPNPSNPLVTVNIAFKIKFTIPTVDINPDTPLNPAIPFTPLNPPQSGMAGEFRFKTTAHLQNLLVLINFQPIPIPPLPQIPVFGLCEPFATNSSGVEAIGITVKQVDVGIPLPPQLAWLGGILNQLMLIVLQNIFSKIQIPLTLLTAGLFDISLQVGPLAEKDQFEVRGTAP
jgi:hypothetical protein